MQVTIEQLNWRGEGLGGGEVFRRVLPGEIVDMANGQVIHASSDRIDPFCQYFERCGGCQLQHWKREPYLEWKKSLITSALAKRGIEATAGEIVDAHGTGRRRVTFHVRKKDGVVTAGFMAPRSHELIDIGQCPILTPALRDATNIARKIGGRLGDCDVSLTAADNGLDVTVKVERKIADEQMPKLAGLVAELKLLRMNVNGNLVATHGTPTIAMGQGLVQLPPGSFLQATRQGEESLSSLVLAAVGKAKSVADLFCGIGPFALRLADKATVTALDTDKPAIASLAQAVRLTTGIKPLKTETRDLMREPVVVSELKEFEAVVFDPPRAGAEAQARQLAKSAVKTIVAVSCDPASFSRDAEILLGGGYKLKTLTAVDQFKYTSHVEIVGVFSRQSLARST
jgi:23S rRNA (uracil1939-C5)-methyltransferase